MTTQPQMPINIRDHEFNQRKPLSCFSLKCMQIMLISVAKVSEKSHLQTFTFNISKDTQLEFSFYTLMKLKASWSFLVIGSQLLPLVLHYTSTLMLLYRSLHQHDESFLVT